jgi:hypothetical protein
MMMSGGSAGHAYGADVIKDGPCTLLSIVPQVEIRAICAVGIKAWLLRY